MVSARPLKVGLMIPSWSGAPDRQAPTWHDVNGLAQQAEAVGFDSVWIADTIVVHPDPSSSMGYWDCWSILAALAAGTPRIELGSLVSGGGFRNPVLLAHLVNTVDEISGGRAILGIGAGEEGQHHSLGISPEGRYGRLEETLTIVRALLREGHVHHEGRFLTVDAELPLRGPRPTGPPIMLGTYPSPGPRMRALAARHADGWNAWLAFDDCSPGKTRPALEGLDDACRAAGRDPATLWRSVAVGVSLPGRRLTFGPWDINDAALRGSPEDIAESLRRFAALGVSHAQVYLGHITPEDIDAFTPVLEHLGTSPLSEQG